MTSPGGPRTFGQRLKHLRQQRGLRQSDLAKLIDLPQSSISSYEADERSPTLQTLESIAAALECTVSVLIGEASNGEMPGSSSWPQRLLELSDYVRQLPPIDQDELLTALNVLAALRLDRLRTQHPRRHKHPPDKTAY